MDFPARFKRAFDENAADIPLRAGRRPVLRRQGELVSAGAGEVADGQMLRQDPDVIRVGELRDV